MYKVSIKEVLKELKHLKANATKKEINNLNFETLDVRSERYCIYGQMTGHCSSERAKKLYAKTRSHIFSFNDFTELELYLLNNKDNYKTQKRIINYLKGGQNTITLK